MVSCVNQKEDADSHPEHFLMPAARKCACITQKSGSHRVTIRYATTERLCEIRWVMYTFSVTVSLKSLNAGTYEERRASWLLWRKG